MFHAAILEDDPRQAESLARMIEASPCATRVEIVGIAQPAVSLAEAFGDGVDILFVDIQLGETRATGIVLVDALVPRDGSMQVIYVSGYLEYASDVYRTKHTWFLPKPVDQSALDAALERAIDNLEQAQQQPLLVRASGSLIQILPQNIVYVESERRKVRIHERGRVIETYAKMSDMEASLPRQFARCHKSFLVNMSFIAELRARDLVLLDGTVLPVSQRCHKALQRCFIDHVGRSV